MTDKLTIINQSLALLRQVQVENLDGTDNITRIINLQYDQHIDECFSLYPWSWALQKVKLNQTTEPVNEYKYAYLLPSEALRVWNVLLGENVSYSVEVIKDYDIQAQGDNRVLLANREDLVVEYVRRQAEELWAVLFRRLVITSFAEKICLELTGNAELQAELYNRAWGTPSQNMQGGQFAAAANADTQQKPPTPIVDLPLTTARFSRGLGGGGRRG